MAEWFKRRLYEGEERSTPAQLLAKKGGGEGGGEKGEEKEEEGRAAELQV